MDIADSSIIRHSGSDFIRRFIPDGRIIHIEVRSPDIRSIRSVRRWKIHSRVHSSELLLIIISFFFLMFLTGNRFIQLFIIVIWYIIIAAIGIISSIRRIRNIRSIRSVRSGSIIGGFIFNNFILLFSGIFHVNILRFISFRTSWFRFTARCILPFRVFILLNKISRSFH